MVRAVQEHRPRETVGKANHVSQLVPDGFVGDVPFGVGPRSFKSPQLVETADDNEHLRVVEDGNVFGTLLEEIGEV